jgi:hypothetical protein
MMKKMRIVIVIVMIANNRYPRDEDTSKALLVLGLDFDVYMPFIE